MLNSLKDLLDRLIPPTPTEPPADAQHTLQLAAAVLLVEVMRADTELGDAERNAVLAALQANFGLAADATARLLELADRTSRTAGDYFEFTTRINDGFSMEQKVEMIEQMWRIAYADGALHGHENYVMSKVSELLYIPHGAYINAKLRAAQAAGIEPGV